ncbi:hypothetical protein Acy02nite_00270 [Actinoplanes cyaneus]|uniref:Uncharacterized protein n=1 Tax=Actinoplanes cyaneus TaxID=52696 RepID=A0A919IBC4_9ACTN|nr:hypothetical protein [Actinoplanes cyaneus]MCW2142597.1 hypothetical protein [Actinoplanes cyaneus]GID62146.1 hypothetical protein Acy02nite_00270 [Actinoplanes cyaneus]
MIEDLVRTAQERQADRAVPAERLLAALPQRAAGARRRRQFGVLGAAMAAAAVVVAVTVPVVALRGSVPEPAVVADAPSLSPGVLVTPTGAAQLGMIAIRYGPAWIPSGFSESIRQADSAGPSGQSLTRVWKKQAGAGDPWSGASIALTIRTEVVDPARTLDTSGQKVDINGAEGWFSPSRGDGKAALAWVAGYDTVLMISTSHVEVIAADLLRMARSVGPALALTSVPVLLGWLPDGWETGGVTISGPSAAAWRYEITAGRSPVASPGPEKSVADSSSVSVVVGTVTEAPAGGEKLTVRGRPARHPVRTDAAGHGLTYLVVDLGQGRVMTLTGEGITLGDLTRIAEQAALPPIGFTPKDLGWLDH